MSDVIPANYELWRKADIWTIQRGILLLLNREMFPAKNEQNMPVLNKFLDILIIAESSLKIGKLPIFHRPEYHEENSEGVLEFEVLPSDFIKWAVLKGYEIPPQLEIKNPVTSTKPATPIQDIFKELYANVDSQRKEYREKRDETLSKYGTEYLTLQIFISRVLLKNWKESSMLSAFCRLVEHGLIIYDNDNPVSFPQLLASLEHRKTQCSFDEDNLDFWDTLKNEKNYQVHIDNVARAHCLKGDETFDWYNSFSDKVIQLTIPNEIKDDVKQDVVDYAEALNYLSHRLQATPDEIAEWIAIKELNAFKKQAGNDKLKPFNFALPKYTGRDDYKGLLTWLFFLRDEIEQFEPVNRFISRAALVERWTRLCGDKENALIHIEDGGRESGLFEYHPIGGVVDLKLGYKSGCFHLDRVREIELRFPDIGNRISNDGAVSQADNEQVLTPLINNNDFEFSGLLIIPKKVDDWVRAIDDMVREFHKQNGKRPNEVQAWGQLWTSPPVGYPITTNTDKGKEDCLNMPSVSPLSKSAFIRRWKKYTNNAQ